jgi:hypothetical protein
MGGGIAMLFVGLLVGGVTASAVWAFVLSGKRRVVEAERAEREQIMASVGETLADADAIETNFRSGALTPEAFRRSLGEKVNVVMHLLRTNMHNLDAYFVKYAEQEARDYLRVIDNPERRQNEEPGLSAAPPVDTGAGMELPDPPETDLFAIAPLAAPTPPAAPEPVDTFTPPPSRSDTNRYESLPAAPALMPIGAVDAADDFEPPPAEPPIHAAETPNQYEPLPAAPPPPSAFETDNLYEPPPAAPTAPSVVDVSDNFEPAESSITDTSIYRLPPAATVREEELVLGESPENIGAAPAQTDVESFEIPAPPPPAQSPAQSQGEAGWTGGDSIEEFEAAFAQFEIPATQVRETEYEETGRFAKGAAADAPQTPEPAMESAAPESHIDDFDHEFTETSSIDRGAILNAMAAAGQAPPAQTPLSVEAPHIPAQMPPPPPPPQQSEHQGITGDDVVDSIDNFFKLN